MVDAVDHGLARRHQAGNDQTRRGTQVGGHDGRTRQALHALDQRHLAVDLDLRAQAHQLVDMHEAVLEDGFGDLHRAIGNDIQRHELGLHVGRETRVFGGAEALTLEAAR
ncbi:hypothetical protein D3C86_1749610 [compost metagenome]